MQFFRLGDCGHRFLMLGCVATFSVLFTSLLLLAFVDFKNLQLPARIRAKLAMPSGVAWLLQSCKNAVLSVWPEWLHVGSVLIGLFLGYLSVYAHLLFDLYFRPLGSESDDGDNVVDASPSVWQPTSWSWSTSQWSWHQVTNVQLSTPTGWKKWQQSFGEGSDDDDDVDTRHDMSTTLQSPNCSKSLYGHCHPR